MNSNKLTNILLIVLIACNALFFIGIHFMRHHHHSHNEMTFRGRMHGSFGRFHNGFEASRGNYGGFHGSFRNHREYASCCDCRM